ncbi:sugar transferase [Actibacterium sp. MT2.3-13A]|uniref:sugar transferase n=1 Tax=Actibacterium sp. MT2.3-13A TaxID=2828332 RepID=UPI001BA72791|nr:sugar transferase [Actibacterium sp. MT2.3-13A]
MNFDIHSGAYSPSGHDAPPETRGDERAASGGDAAKAVFDRCFSVLALLFFAPFLIVISLVILLGDGGPILFRHKRIGRDGRIFNCLKFRTMANDAEERLKAILDTDPKARAEWDANQKLEDDPRITCIGEFFRKTSLDELPQFWNVLRGEMSVVGPRPIVAEEAHHYGEHFKDYLSVRPGVTGLWQVMGRSRTTYDERVAMDIDYVRNRSFRMDIWIILKTIKVMLVRDGAC